MAKGLKIASWIVAIAIVVLCNGCFALLIGLSFAQEHAGVSAHALETLIDMSGATMYLLIPALQVASIVLGIIAAASKRPATIVETRRLMLLFKVGLIPFFLMGAVLEAVCLLLGLHPVLPFIGWAMGAVLATMGWFTMISGSIWAIATAVHLYRQRAIRGGELAAHIVLQLMFVADVVDAIILFVRSRPASTHWRQALTDGQAPASSR